jgi:hypothetical protein
MINFRHMKSIPVILGLLLAFVCQAEESFEGKYTMEMSGQGDKASMTIWTKDSHIRMAVASKDMPGEMIMRDGMSTMLMIMPEQRMYMEMQIPDMSGKMGGQEEKGGDDVPFEKTGNTKEIEGFKAHEFVYEKGAEKMVIWATEELGSMPMARGPAMQGYAAAMQKVTGLSSFFPLEMTGYKKGKKDYQMRIKDIEKKELSDSMFQPPAGFRKMTMPAGMGGFMRN